jgi:hypothetical protein
VKVVPYPTLAPEGISRKQLRMLYVELTELIVSSENRSSIFSLFDVIVLLQIVPSTQELDVVRRTGGPPSGPRYDVVEM